MNSCNEIAICGKQLVSCKKMVLAYVLIKMRMRRYCRLNMKNPCKAVLTTVKHSRKAVNPLV